MYFELIKNARDDQRSSSEHQVSIHFCVYNKDSKGRQVVGSPISSKCELDVKIGSLQAELEEIRREAAQYLP